MERLVATAQFSAFMLIALPVIYWTAIRRSWPALRKREKWLLLTLLATIVVVPLICIWLIFPIDHVRQMNAGAASELP